MEELKLPNLEEFKLPKINNEIGITREEYDELIKRIRILNFQMQEVNDNLSGRIDFKNLLKEGIEGFNIKDGAVTAGKITTGKLQSINGKTYFDLDNNIVIIEVSADRWIKFGDIGSGKYGILASRDEVEKFRLEADSGDAYFSGKAVGAVYNE